MMLHFGTELPDPKLQVLDEQRPELTAKEVQILRDQIRKNGRLIDGHLARLDLLVNKERYPQEANFLGKIRHQVDLLMAENDTFRKTLWNHMKIESVQSTPKQTH